MLEPDRVLSTLGGEVRIFADPATAAEAASRSLIDSIRSLILDRGQARVGLATGSTPEPVYAHLVEAYRSGLLSFEKVTTFNLDEYYPMGPLNPKSYRSYMDRHLFRHVNLAPNRAHVLDGTVPLAFASEHAAQFDRWIASEGSLDLQLLGLGRNAHIGFNEPSDLPVEDALNLPTRLIDLHPTTIADAARDFGSEEKVPRSALTMGIASILTARSIVVLAFGERKAEAVAASLTGPITARVPGSMLQTASSRVVWWLDRASASRLA